MKRTIFVLLLITLTACTVRMGAFAPRQPDIQEHREAGRGDCLGCHDITVLSDHKPADDCLHCHHLIKGV